MVIIIRKMKKGEKKVKEDNLDDDEDIVQRPDMGRHSTLSKQIIESDDEDN